MAEDGAKPREVFATTLSCRLDRFQVARLDGMVWGDEAGERHGGSLLVAGGGRTERIRSGRNGRVEKGCSGRYWAV